MFYILRLGNITLASLKPWSSEPFSIYCSELTWYYIYIYSYRYQELTSRLPFACRCVSSSASCRCNSTTCDSCAWSANQKDCKDAKVRALWISSIPFRKIHRHHVISFQCSSLLICSYFFLYSLIHILICHMIRRCVCVCLCVRMCLQHVSNRRQMLTYWRATHRHMAQLTSSPPMIHAPLQRDVLTWDFTEVVRL